MKEKKSKNAANINRSHSISVDPSTNSLIENSLDNKNLNIETTENSTNNEIKEDGDKPNEN